MCTASHCANGVKDATETDIDCGDTDCGSCSITVCRAVVLNAAPASPQPSGTVVNLTATADCSGGAAQYSFVLVSPGGGATTLRGFAPGNTFAWNTAGLASGSYTLRAQALPAGAAAGAVTSADVPYVLGAGNPPQPGYPARVSVATGGGQGTGTASDAKISGNGRYVAFATTAALVAGDTNGVSDIYVRDLTTGETSRVSIGSDGATSGNAGSFTPYISDDGRFVTFYSDASNLVPNDTNGQADVFIRDRTGNTTLRASVGTGGTQTNSGSYQPAISADGRFVAFVSYASNIVANDTNNALDLFLYDRLSASTLRASVTSTAVQANGESFYPALSKDGRFLTYYSTASNLVVNDTNGKADIFLYDRLAATTERVSVDSAALQSDGDSYSPVVSATGQYVTFYSRATNLVAGDTNGQFDVFVRNRAAGTTVRVSVDSAGNQGNGLSSQPFLSADGRFVAFFSQSTNLVANDTNGQADVFVRDLSTSTTKRVSVAADGFATQGNGPSYDPAFSSDGTFLVFSSQASNLVTSDTNGQADVFITKP